MVLVSHLADWHDPKLTAGGRDWSWAACGGRTDAALQKETGLIPPRGGWCQVGAKLLWQRKDPVIKRPA